MKYQLRPLPRNWAEQVNDTTGSIVQLLIANWPDRPIPGTAFFQLEDHRDDLIELGWLAEVQK
jgi:hypothetical protein